MWTVYPTLISTNHLQQSGSTFTITAVSSQKSREALIEATGAALDAITARDARGFFKHCSYSVSDQSL